MKLLTPTQCNVVKLADRLGQMVKASAKTTSCKPLSGHTSSTTSRVSLSVWTCLLMVWLLSAGQRGFTVHRACLEDGHMD